MSTNTRVDAIGQELKVNECAYVISKSSNAGGDVGLITRINAKTVQINGKTTMDDYRVVIVTENLMAMGKQNKVDSLRKTYADKVDDTDPLAKPKKPSIRFILIQDKAGDQHLIRFEGETRDDSMKVIATIPELNWVTARYDHKVLSRQQDWRSQEKYLAFTDAWRFGKECIFALRTLPDNIARYAHETSAYVAIPHHDKQPTKQVLPKK